MAEDLQDDKTVEVKGIDTVTGADEPIVPEGGDNGGDKKKFVPASEKKKQVPKALEYRDPVSEQDAFNLGVSGRAARGGTSLVHGQTGSIDTKALQEAYAKVNLADGIPDAYERDKFVRNNGSKMVELFDENEYGIRFEKDLADLYKYKEKQYPIAVKNFLDELDENQAWYSEFGNILGKTIGGTVTNVLGGLGGAFYSAFSALINWDYEKFWDNEWWDNVDRVNQGIDETFVVYGGSDYWDFKLNPETGVHEFHQKEFLSRFISDPIKSLNADIVPTVNFVAGIVGQELLYTTLTAGTGGLAAPGLAGAAARGGRILKQGAGWANRFRKTSKANRLIRGLDKADDLTKAAELAAMTERYHKGIGKVASAYRSSAYESAIIANDTQEATMQNLLTQYHLQQGGTIKEDGTILDANGNQVNELISPDKATRRKMEVASNDAASMAFFTNMPLVAGSNMIQFPRVFLRNYKAANAARGRGMLGKIGYDDAAKKYYGVAHDNPLMKKFGYGVAIAKGPITEAWEEYAQGALQNGLTDYYTSTYDTPEVRSYMDMLNAMRKAGKAQMKTIEGRDSVTIGALMGLIGLHAPVVKRNKENRFGFSLKMKSFGGSLQEFKEAREKVTKAQQQADWLNSEGQISPQLRNNFLNHVRHKAIQSKMDWAAETGDQHVFKNAEFDQLFSLIHKREKEGLGDTFEQELDALDNMSVQEFNELHATKGIDEYTAEEKDKAIANARETIRGAQDSIAKVQALMNAPKRTVLGTITNAINDAVRKHPKGDAINKAFITEEMQEQMAYAHAAMKNSQKREAALLEKIKEKTGHAFSWGSMDKVIAELVGISTKDGKLEYTNRAEDVKKEILKEWKKQDPNDYNEHAWEVIPLLDDVMKLKARKGEAAKMYHDLFTPKGAKRMAKFAAELHLNQQKEMLKKLEEMVEADVEAAKNAGLEGEAVNEASVSGGESVIADNRINDSVVAGLEELKGVDTETQPVDMIEADMLRILDKHPGLLTLVKDRLREKGFSVKGIKTAKEFKALSSPENNIYGALFKELTELQKEADAIQAANASSMEYDSAEDMNQSSQYPEETIDYEKTKGDVLEGLFNFEGNANSEYTMVNTQEKEVVDGKLVIDKATGQPKDSPAMSDPSYPLDAKKVNSPDFLNNKQLAEENHNVEIRVADITNNKWAQDNMDNLTPENYPMDVVHIDPVTGKETFLSRLPAFQAGKSANQLRALRNEVMRRDKIKTDPGAKTRAERIQEISQEIETLEKEIEAAQQEKVPYQKGDIVSSEVIVEADETTADIKELVDQGNAEGKNTKITKVHGTDARGTSVDIRVVTKDGAMTFAVFLKPKGTPTEKSVEQKVAEIQENQEFIQLSEDEETYVNTKTGKVYQRVTKFIEQNEKEDKGDQALLDTAGELGTKIDTLVRDFFADNLQDLDTYDIADREKVDAFLGQLQKLKEKFEANGETVLANDIILYNDEIGVAGTVDLLTYDQEGNFRIYDMKTMRGNNFEQKYQGEEVSKYDSDSYGKPKRQKHTEQLSTYRILMNNTHGVLADSITVIPIELAYEAGDQNTDKLVLLDNVELETQDVVHSARLETEDGEIDTAQLEERVNALKQEMSSLSGELVVDVIDGPNIFGKISELEGMTPRKRAESEAKIKEEFGEGAMERAQMIDENFQDIIDQITKSKINIFFHPKTGTHKEC